MCKFIVSGFLVVWVVSHRSSAILYASENILDQYQQYENRYNFGRHEAINQEYPFSKGHVKPREEYDFIVVGSGPAGAVLASRLSEDLKWNVLLLEAGKVENLFTDIPALCSLFQLTDYNWGYKMEKQDGVCQGMVDQQCAWPRGKALGGTSVINYMIYTRGNKRDFDMWAAQGNPGWSWDEVVPYYVRSENASLRDADPGWHGYGGYLDVEDVRFRTPLIEAFVDAGREMGRRVLDYNGKSQYGFAYVQANTRRGRRCSAAKAFLRPVEGRPNLRILPLSRVTKVLIDPVTKTAYGVEYLRNRKRYTATVRKEVILSAGAFASPQLLMLSGVGPTEHLEELGIEVKMDLPVGKFMQDHLTFVGLTFLVNESVSLTLDHLVTPPVLLDYILSRNGPLTSLGGVEGLGYIKTNISKDLDDYPDIELIFLAGSLNSDGGGPFKDGLRIGDDLYNTVYKPINNRDCWSIIPMLLHPKSHGHLRLKSTNIFHHPVLYGGYFTDADGEDVRTMVEAVKEIIRISKTRAFQRFGSVLHDIPFPTCRHLEFGSDAYWECAVRTITPSLHHQVGTCKMGPADDPTAVVDAELRVHGIKRLRVADCSIIPFALSAHTNAPSFMIGEKAADFIKQVW